MKAMYSKGPWHVEPEEASDHHGLVICAADAIVATITPEEHGPDLDKIDRANARLIAAAPDLLTVCELMVASGIRANATLNAAIAKARGGE